MLSVNCRFVTYAYFLAVQKPRNAPKISGCFLLVPTIPPCEDQVALGRGLCFLPVVPILWTKYSERK